MMMMMKLFPAKCANSSVWIIYGDGAVKSGQDGRDLIPIVWSRHDATKMPKCTAEQKSCIVIDSLCWISPNAKRLTGLMFGVHVIQVQLEKIGQKSFFFFSREVGLVLCISRTLSFTTEILGIDWELFLRDHIIRGHLVLNICQIFTKMNPNPKGACHIIEQTQGLFSNLLNFSGTIAA